MADLPLTCDHWLILVCCPSPPPPPPPLLSTEANSSHREGRRLRESDPAELLSPHRPPAPHQPFFHTGFLGEDQGSAHQQPRGHLVPPCLTSSTIPSQQAPHSSTATRVRCQGRKERRNLSGASDFSRHSSPSVTLSSAIPARQGEETHDSIPTQRPQPAAFSQLCRSSPGARNRALPIPTCPHGQQRGTGIAATARGAGEEHLAPRSPSSQGLSPTRGRHLGAGRGVQRAPGCCLTLPGQGRADSQVTSAKPELSDPTLPVLLKQASCPGSPARSSAV